MDRDPCPLTLPMCAGIVATAWVFILTQVEGWSVRDGAGVSVLFGFCTWVMIGAFQIVGVAWELWKQDRKEGKAK